MEAKYLIIAHCNFKKSVFIITISSNIATFVYSSKMKIISHSRSLMEQRSGGNNMCKITDM